jgi:hypothetical protein
VAACPQVANSIVKTPYDVPKILPLPLALAKYCDQQLWKENFLSQKEKVVSAPMI